MWVPQRSYAPDHMEDFFFTDTTIAGLILALCFIPQLQYYYEYLYKHI